MTGCQTENGAESPEQTLHRFSVHSGRVGDNVRYGWLDRASAQVFLFLDMKRQKALVILVEGNDGTSIANGAPCLASFIHQQHIEPKALPLQNVRWISRDEKGIWEEVLFEPVPQSDQAKIEFKPLGAQQTEDALRTTDRGWLCF